MLMRGGETRRELRLVAWVLLLSSRKGLIGERLFEPAVLVEGLSLGLLQLGLSLPWAFLLLPLRLLRTLLLGRKVCVAAELVSAQLLSA